MKIQKLLYFPIDFLLSLQRQAEDLGGGASGGEFKYTSIGGQAVLEGVMMRSPHYIGVAVRDPEKSIAIQSKAFKSVSERFKFLKKPVLRGVVTLIESMIEGMKALSFSAEIAGVEDAPKEGGKPQKISSAAIAASMAMAFALAMGLFVALPHFISSFVAPVDDVRFHIADGFIKMTILLAYVGLIGKLPDIRRVFQYHGAEHKVIYTFEKGQSLTVENAKQHTTLHPRCGTSFLLFLVLISIAVFTILFPVAGLTHFSDVPILNHLAVIGVKILLMMPVSGLAYEFIKVCAVRMDKGIYRLLIWPGLTLQYLTTREPEADQLEVALASLKQVLALEKSPDIAKARHVRSLGELETVAAGVADFPEL